MAAEGHSYRGFLYAGLMIDAEGTPKVLEYNVRFGDPETQPIMLRLQSDLVALCLAALRGELDRTRADWSRQRSLGVVMEGLAAAAATGCKVFHAGTALGADGAVLTAGGRVLCVCALGDSVSAAQALAYRGVDEIRWQRAYCRRDIGYRAIARERGS